MMTSLHTTAATSSAPRGAAFRPRRLVGCAALLTAAAILGGCADQAGSTLTAADLQQDSSLASWQVAGPTVASQARLSDRQQCYGGGGSQLVDDCDPLSIRYDGP